MTTTTITAKAIETSGIPAADKLTSEAKGQEYLAKATDMANRAQNAMAKGEAKLAAIVHQVKTSGIAIYAVEADKRHKADARATGFSLWYRSIGLDMAKADKLASYGRYLAAGLPVGNLGQARAIIALENANGKEGNTAEWRSLVADAVADAYATADKATANGIKATASETLGLAKAKRPAANKANEANEADQRPAAKLETLADVARMILSGTTDAAAIVSGDLSGFSAAEWKALGSKLASLQAATAEYRLAKVRKATAPSV